jgi:predicted ATP-dependent endonuclease of OLD family
MYLEKVRIWNWRRFGEGKASKPAIEISFNKHLNVLLGENDSGKTAIIDAMKIGLNTNSQDVNWLREIDFYDLDKPIKIEYIYCDLSEAEEAYFFEWVHFVKDVSYLRVLLEAEQVQDLNKKTRITKNVSGGEEGRESPLTDDVKQLLTVTYLKPLRDAEVELSPGNRSRFAQILKSLSVFQENDGASKKEIEEILTNAFGEVQNIIDSPVIGKMQDLVESFFDKTRKRNPIILPKNMKFNEFLKKLELNLGEIGSGLGSSNLLFMAAELLLLSDNKFGPQIALIEEIEAHIHPQSQLRLIKYFERKSKEEGIQYILTSHSPILASSIALEHLILIYSNAAFPMKAGETLLETDDYKFLERFLDSTKSNMFFAQGIICVEGDAENLLLPAVAEVVGRSLHDYGVSIVNVGNLSCLPSSYFVRREEELMSLKLSSISLKLTIMMLCLLWIIPMKAAQAETTPQFLLNMTNNTSIVGNDIMISISGSQLQDLYAYEVNLTFDANKLQFKNAVSGLPGGFSVNPILDGNKLQLARTNVGASSGLNGDATLYTLTFKSIASGTADISLTGLTLVDSQLDSSEVVSSAKASIVITTGTGTGGGSNPSIPSNNDPNTTITLTPEMITNEGDGKVIVEVAEAVKVVKVPLNLFEIDGQTSLVVMNDNLKVEFPAGLLLELMGNMSEDQMRSSTISLTMTPLSTSDSKNLVTGAGDLAGANLNLASEVYEFKLELMNENNQSTLITKFTKPITLRFKVDPSANEKLVSIYYIGEDSTLKFIGGNIANGEIVAEVYHFSKYAAIEFNKQFDDVPNDHWASDVIKQLAAKQIVNGTSSTTFEPSREVSRADFTALLVRALKLTSKGDIAFSDVTESDWFFNEVAIAVKAGIVEGKSESFFDSAASISREEMITMLMRAYQIHHNETTTQESSNYNDENMISSWALPHVRSAKILKLVQGREGNLFAPHGVGNRAEAAQMIYNLMNLLETN